MNKLIEIYNKGWQDCPDNISHEDDYEDIKERRAYRLGWIHYILGDDQPSIDALPEEKILEMIMRP